MAFVIFRHSAIMALSLQQNMEERETVHKNTQQERSTWQDNHAALLEHRDMHFLLTPGILVHQHWSRCVIQTTVDSESLAS